MAIITNHGSWQQVLTIVTHVFHNGSRQHVLAIVTAYTQPRLLTACFSNRHSHWSVYPVQNCWHLVLAAYIACFVNSHDTAYAQPRLLTACFGNNHGIFPTMALDSMFWQQSWHIPNRGSWQHVLATATTYAQPCLLTACFGNSHSICPAHPWLSTVCFGKSHGIIPNRGSWLYVLATVMAYTQWWLLTACVCNSHDICLTMGLDSMFCQQSWHIPNHDYHD